MSRSVCRWGFLSTASIARKNWKAIYCVPQATLTAVASREVSRAQQFIAECQRQAPLDPPPIALGSYDELIESADVDAVYVPVPSNLRTEWAVRAANAGKHVLLEKPCGNDAGQLRRIIDACRANGVLLMDGTMLMHSLRLPQARAVLDDGQSVGKIRRMASQGSFAADPDWLKNNIRVHANLEPLGCLGDIGWYCARIFLWAMQWQLPAQAVGRVLVANDVGVPLEFAGDLYFAEGVSASFFCSFLTENQQWVNIAGERGYLRIDDFMLPFVGSETRFYVAQSTFVVDGCAFDMEPRIRCHQVAEYGSGTANAQESRMIAEFSRQVTSGKIDPQWAKYALCNMQVIDALWQSAQSGSRPVTLPVE